MIFLIRNTRSWKERLISKKRGYYIRRKMKKRSKNEIYERISEEILRSSFKIVGDLFKSDSKTLFRELLLC